MKAELSHHEAAPRRLLNRKAGKGSSIKIPRWFKAFVNAAECAKRTMNLPRKLRRFDAVMTWKEDMLRVGEREDEQSDSCD